VVRLGQDVPRGSIPNLESLFMIPQVNVQLLDEDGDGEVSWVEYYNMHKGSGRNWEEDAKQSFEAIDTDGDGHISKQEWTNMVWGFFMGVDPTSPSRFMWNNFDKMQGTIEVPVY
jgi:Ca2+-binding EF-hand superfamily protein